MTEREKALVDSIVDDIGQPVPFPLRKKIANLSVAEQLLNVAESIKEIHGEIDAMQADFKKRLMDLNEEVDKRLLAIRKSMGSRA